MKELIIKMGGKYFLYALLCLYVFAVVYAIGCFIHYDVNWLVNGFENTIEKRVVLLKMFALTFGLGVILCLVVEID